MLVFVDPHVIWSWLAALRTVAFPALGLVYPASPVFLF